MRRELLDLASELARRAEPFAIVTVVARKAPVSAQAGDAALVTREGTLHGWVGGACTQPTVVAEVRRALADGRPRLVALDPDPEAPPRAGVSVFPMTCHSGGSVEILIQPVLPAPRLLVLGLSPTARALAALGKAMGYSVLAVDPGADASAFPGADVFTDPKAIPKGAPAAPLFAVVATQGQWDEEAVRAALDHAPQYLGVVASPKRFAEMRESLAAHASAAAVARVESPAGLDLGARLPEEIAISILAEIVKETRAAAPVAPAEPATAIDPVCGMTVQVSGARHKAQHGDLDYFFCCAGCRDRFVATPEYSRPGSALRPEIQDLQAALERECYIAEPAIATGLFLAREMQKPLLVEGDAGVGKTELAKVLARIQGTELIRLQCYEGLDVQTALYEWDYPRQLLRLRLAETRGEDTGELDKRLFSRDYLLERPLLRAITRSEAPVLLIDEVDRADDGFEAFLLELLSDFQVTIPELGTIRAQHRPHVILTSNRTRELGDALRRRCLYLFIEHPSFEKEVRIIRTRWPQAEDRLAREVGRFLKALRDRRLVKPPGVAETLDFTRALLSLRQDSLDAEVVTLTLGCLLKDRHDLETVTPSEVEALVSQARGLAS